MDKEKVIGEADRKGSAFSHMKTPRKSAAAVVGSGTLENSTLKNTPGCRSRACRLVDSRKNGPGSGRKNWGPAPTRITGSSGQSGRGEHCRSTDRHFAVAQAFLEAASDVLIEKPITQTLGGEELVAAARRYHRSFRWAFRKVNPAFLAVRERIRTPLFLEVHRLTPFGKGHGVDVILDLMIHDLDII